MLQEHVHCYCDILHLHRACVWTWGKLISYIHSNFLKNSCQNQNNHKQGKLRWSEMKTALKCSIQHVFADATFVWYFVISPTKFWCFHASFGINTPRFVQNPVFYHIQVLLLKLPQVVAYVLACYLSFRYIYSASLLLLSQSLLDPVKKRTSVQLMKHFNVVLCSSVPFKPD